MRATTFKDPHKTPRLSIIQELNAKVFQCARSRTTIASQLLLRFKKLFWFWFAWLMIRMHGRFWCLSFGLSFGSMLPLSFHNFATCYHPWEGILYYFPQVPLISHPRGISTVAYIIWHLKNYVHSHFTLCNQASRWEWTFTYTVADKVVSIWGISVGASQTGVLQLLWAHGALLPENLHQTLTWP